MAAKMKVEVKEEVQEESGQNLIVAGGRNYYTDEYFQAVFKTIPRQIRGQLAKEIQKLWDEQWSGEGLSDDELVTKIVAHLEGGGW